ncbi:hypothetical protein [Streptomyces hoynatensis]|uniref:Integrase n=1 Tax=Streptomyces hoynatensis TaxID=1141874 RepID=A0A3A9YWH3_9ACTN|nr:hypothetical protein [Streptomyces hoynatensis]RKN40451.1 hypothetical protein D7294_18575 [Streptomyces hoynatensis]
MRIQAATEPGDPKRHNEDYAAYTAYTAYTAYAAAALPAPGWGGALVVLDGVTGPMGPDGCRHGVAWFAGRLGGALLELAGSRRESSLEDCLAEAISRTADAHRDTCDLSHPRTPQATAALARWDQERVEYLVLCDSVLLLDEAGPAGEGAPGGGERAGGRVRAVLDTRLGDLRPAARRLPRGERAAFVEGLRNAPGGFWTAAADPSVARRAVTGSLARGRVRGLAALTDGLGRWVETFGIGDWPDLYALLAERGPDAAIDEVRAAEAADPLGAAFPRAKTHDDASVVIAEL